jgi:adenosylmethionine-8-amino-7-oxononanoate aminotransferase
VPLGATLYNSRVADAIQSAHGGPQTGHTFTGHTAACAAGLAVQKLIEREGLIEHARVRGEQLKAELRTALGDIPEVGDIRGRGFFIGLELVADPVTKAPFDHTLQLHARIGANAFGRGLIVYPCTGNVDGISGDTVILAPPFNASEVELAELVETLALSIKDAVGAVRGT